MGRLGAALPDVACQGPVPLSRTGRFGAANPSQSGAAATELTRVETGSARPAAARRSVARLDSDPAVGQTVAKVLLAESLEVALVRAGTGRGPSDDAAVARSSGVLA